jgi:hypothetical protein
VNGIGDGKYGPNNPVTHEQLATILYRFEQSEELNLPDITGEVTYADNSDIADYAQNAVRHLTTQGIFRDIPLTDGKFNPQGSATRAEVAAVLHRFVEASEAPAVIPPATESATQPATEPTTPPATESATEPATEPATSAPSSGTLTFVKQESFDIPSGNRYSSITSFNVSGAVSGGKAPYTFSKSSGPSWLNVSSAGVVSGSRQGVAEASAAVIMVKDANGETAIITINIGEVN